VCLFLSGFALTLRRLTFEATCNRSCETQGAPACYASVTLENTELALLTFEEKSTKFAEAYICKHMLKSETDGFP
jgi:hypothetical protein